MAHVHEASWEGSNVITNRSAGSVLVETDLFPLGFYQFGFIVFSSTTEEFDFIELDSADNINHTIRFRVAGGETAEILLPTPFEVHDDHKYRIRNVTALTGGTEVTASIFFEHLLLPRQP